MSIEEWVIPDSGQQFKGCDFRDLCRPGVYVFILNGKALYVGMGKRVLGRIGNKHKQAQEAIEQCDQVLIYPCVSPAAALQLEKQLIGKLQPKYNWRQRTGLLSDWLGIKSANA